MKNVKQKIEENKTDIIFWTTIIFLITFGWLFFPDIVKKYYTGLTLLLVMVLVLFLKNKNSRR